MRRILLLGFTTGALMMLVLATTARAVNLQTSDTSQPWQTWADAAQVPTWAGTLPLTVHGDYVDCGGMQANGCSSLTPQVDQTTGQIMPQGTPLAAVSTEIYDGPTAPQARATLYHELGQVFWAEYMTPADEASFMSIVGLKPDVSQWGNWLYGTRVVNGVTIHFPPFEWFAEGYRYCATYGVNQPLGVNDEEGLAYPGDLASFATQQREVCQLIDQVGLDNGISTPAQATYPAPVDRAKSKRPVRVARLRPRGHHRIVLTWGRRRIW